MQLFSNPTPFPCPPTVKTVDVRGKRVLVRVDYNIPEGNTVDGLADDYRIVASLPTIRYLVQNKARVILLTHRGRPQGQPVTGLSTQPLAIALGHLLHQPVQWEPDCIGRGVENAVENLQPGQVLLLENTRFHLGEQLNQQQFAKKLAKLGDIFVNEAFATAHRAHASVSGLAAAMPVSTVGLDMAQEIDWLNDMVGTPVRPQLAILGGTQLALKLDMIEKLIARTDIVMVGGALAHTFLASRDLPVGRSPFEPAYLERARDILAEAGVLGCRLLLPLDAQVVDTSLSNPTVETKQVTRIAPHEAMVDIGPQTLETWLKVLKKAGSILWIGALGRMEGERAYTESTLAIAKAMTGTGIPHLVGGDGLLRVLREGDMRGKLARVSTAGGALMEALAGHSLPALQVMQARREGWSGKDRRTLTR